MCPRGQNASNGGRGLFGWPSYPALQWLAVVEHELLLFAAIWFAVFALDELLVDLAWLRLRLLGHGRTLRMSGCSDAELAGVAAVLVPAWHESQVIGAMVTHTLRSWPQRHLRIYVGCYRNDTATLEALAGTKPDPRLRVVIHDRDGPTTKADCLNRLYRAICEDERRARLPVRALILHDAEDMVHPAALSAMDRALDSVDFVQLPVRPEPQCSSRWVAGHYCDEFAEAHARDMVVRHHIGAALPSAGVGCAFSRRAIDRIIAHRACAEPFAAECLTEDYECGLLVNVTGGRSAFLRMRADDGTLVATREFFPGSIAESVRQKARWVHGIAFQGWDRLGWNLRLCDLWMRLRDRRGPLVAVVICAAYLMLLLWPVLLLAQQAGLAEPVPDGPLLEGLLAFNFASLMWRLVMRALFTTREYGLREGLLAVLRFPVGNVIAVMAARRALMAYVRVLLGGRLRWDHTVHRAHLAQVLPLALPLAEPRPFPAPA